ncbi:HlyD family efflux transporter periplasmic adaptor subunit [Candidatus Laterigemmans baculatus]|uniref:HlyD family efflux transporter periplasmic adaptor subunit n=1 Tax=Candidatus Laterigemmans baculatus TaxID=2770505 RepID=UPI0013DC3011|nr:HlyD family efflux transporter periplasmic adaptor subunit [Candidatus Laterigemmans baculatus]
MAGCDRERPAAAVEEPQRLPVIAALDAPPGEAILAQGQLEPAGGVLAIVAPPGDRIEAITVAAGDAVREGMVVVRLAGRAAREAELAVAEARLAEARQTVEAETATAQARLQVAQVGVTQNQNQLRRAENYLAQARAEGGELELLERTARLAEEKLAQLRQAAAEPASRRLVSETSVRQQALAAEAARAELEAAEREAEAAVESAALALEAAEKELQASRLAIQAATATAPLASLQKQIELLQLQVANSDLISPIDGVVLAVDASSGAATSGAAVLRVADTSRMVCRAEVPIAELTRVALGAEAKMDGGGLPQPLSGRVASISRVIGAPRLPSPNPMAQVDWRAVDVVIEIDPADAEAAARVVHARVDVAIRAVDAGPADAGAVEAGAVEAGASGADGR